MIDLIIFFGLGVIIIVVAYLLNMLVKHMFTADLTFCMVNKNKENKMNMSQFEEGYIVTGRHSGKKYKVIVATPDVRDSILVESIPEGRYVTFAQDNFYIEEESIEPITGYFSTNSAEIPIVNKINELVEEVNKLKDK